MIDRHPLVSNARRGVRPLALAVTLAAVSAIVIALWHLLAATAGLEVVEARPGGIPVTLYRPAAASGPRPAVVVAHGFAGSRRMMQPYAITLARNGYLAVTFDFPGHGDNAAPFVASLANEAERLRRLRAALEPAIGFALAQPDADGRLALLGHSMAGDALARYAADHPTQVMATLLISPYLSPGAPTATLRNLLLVYGALEPVMLHRQGLDAIAAATGLTEVGAGQTYGDPTAGSGRRLVLVDGVEHIGVLYGRGGLAAALDWLNRSFGRVGDGTLDHRGGWLGLLYLGLIALAWPLSRWLPRLAAPPRGAGLGWRRLWPAAVVPALLTPVLLWPAPGGLLPILLADYLVLHFAVYGLLTLLMLWLIRRRHPAAGADRAAPAPWRGLALATLAVTLYAVLALALPTDRFVTTLLPGPARLPLVLALLAGTLSYFVADEWLTRGGGAARGAYAATKALFLFSLLLAVALNLNELFFLIIIVPAILVLFMIYGLFSAWSYHRTGHPLPGAVATALAFASAIAVTFPLVD